MSPATRTRKKTAQVKKKNDAKVLQKKPIKKKTEPKNPQSKI
jgi:hypothetical protein